MLWPLVFRVYLVLSRVCCRCDAADNVVAECWLHLPVVLVVGFDLIDAGAGWTCFCDGLHRYSVAVIVVVVLVVAVSIAQIKRRLRSADAKHPTVSPQNQFNGSRW